jgi:hypothetical protein
VLVDDGLPLHAAVSRATLAMAMMAAAVRAAGGHARHGQRMTRMRLFIVPPQGWVIVLAASVCRAPGTPCRHSRFGAAMPALS